MRPPDALVQLPPLSRRPRHEHRVERFSRDGALLTSLRDIGVDREGARLLVARIGEALAVDVPELGFHRGRGPHTGYCVEPRAAAIRRHGEGGVIAWEAAHSPWPITGMIRLGDPTSLATLAHEAAHHLVHSLDPASTPAHGKLWVSRFDDAAEVIAAATIRSTPIPPGRRLIT